MEEIKTIEDVLKMDITTNISTKQLQDAYKITQELNGIYYGDYDKLSDDQLKYKIAHNLYYLSLSDTKEKQGYLDKAYGFSNSIFSDKSDDIKGTANLNFLLKCRLIKEFIELGEQKNLDKAYEFNDSISSCKLDKIDIANLNFFVRCRLIEEFTKFGEQENLDKAYKVFEQVLNNPKEIDINKLIKYTNKLLEKYKKLKSEENRYNIEFLEKKASQLEVTRETSLNDVFAVNVTKAPIKQLQRAYITTQKLCGYDYNDCNDLTNDQLKYVIARNLYYLSPSNKQKKQKYLNKAYEFNDSISSGKLDRIDIANLNFFVRCRLIEEFTKFGEQENLDKAYKVLQQVLEKSNGINFNELIKYRNKLLEKYEELNTPVILEEESRKLSSAEKIFDKVLEGQGQRTGLGSHN